jgi:small subunit ribosomal protein S8
MNSPYIDLVIRLKNGYLARKSHIESPHSRLREEILAKLKALGYVAGYEVSGDIIKTITIELKYTKTEPAVTDVKLYSTPGRRWYVSAKDLKPVLNGIGFAILTTPKGIMTNIEAKKANLGGELLFDIW